MDTQTYRRAIDQIVERINKKWEEDNGPANRGMRVVL